jgi:hypothetical protein
MTVSGWLGGWKRRKEDGETERKKKKEIKKKVIRLRFASGFTLLRPDKTP